MRKRFATTLLYGLLIFLQLVLSCWVVNAQRPISNIINFTKNNYQASNQNWSVAHSPNGFMYFANHSGLLEFDGITWKLHPLPNETIMRAVMVASDSLIYTSGYRELGFWKPNANGHLVYHSLNHLAESYFSSNEEFWNIAVLDDKAYFHSFSNILVYENGQINRVTLPGFTNTMHRVGDEIYLASSQYGIFKINGTASTPVITSKELKGTIPRFILPYQENKLMIGTNSNGIFIWDGQKLSQWNPAWNDYFRENEINRGYFTPKGNLIIGTILDGIVIFNPEGEEIAKYNAQNGLQNNTVLGISSDRFNNIWLALDSGIDFISNDQNHGFKIEAIPGIGAVYDAAIFENKIYLGTNQGLFRKRLYDSDSSYELVPETQNQVWYCRVIGDHLFVGHNEGTLVIKGDQQQFVSKQSGGFSIRKDPHRPDYLIESTYSNITRIKKQGNTYIQDGTIKGFFDLIRYIEIDHLGAIWASHMHRGVYKLQLNDKRDSVISSTYFGANSVFQKDHSIHVFKVENRIVFTTEEKLFTYDDLNDSIISYSFLNDKLGEFVTANRIITAPDHHYWFITKERIGLFYIFNNEVIFKKDYPLTLFANNELIDDFENILPITESKAIVCLENGIAQLDAAIPDSLSEIVGFKPQLRELQLTDNRGEETFKPTFQEEVKLQFKYHNLQLRYSFPLFTHHPIYFQSYLKGLDQNWSERSTTPRFDFDRLPIGKYQLQVKAIDQWGNESQINTLSIEVMPPWYLSNYARTLYLLAFIAILLGFRAWGIRQTRRKEKEEKEKREQELIRLRNEKLRDEIQHKSKELANSTMSMLKKNEFLMDLKNIIDNQKEQLGSRFPDKYYNHLTKKIDQNISSDDDWQLFETNFERAHEQFLKKLKEQHPELSSKDLRLCAYLRMSLSSKEIAPLLGISVRGVENHRYRLRKKMNLEHDEKLSEMILEL